MKYFAGIGSRETPFDIQLLMYDIAINLANKYTLRSGHAIGADISFENGCDSVKGPKEIFVAADCTKEAMKYSSKFHPNWKACSEYARKLHGRNAMIILGRNMDSPVDRVICWTKDGKDSGGTGQALRIAQDNKIIIYNLYFDDVKKKFINFIY
jgi:hypothetical protein